MANNIVGILSDKLIEISGSKLKYGYVYCSEGLIIHMKNHGHSSCIPFISRLNEIINSPNYVGISPKENQKLHRINKAF